MKLTSIIYFIKLRILQLISRKFQLYFFFSAGNKFQEHVNVKTVKSLIPIRQVQKSINVLGLKYQ